MEPVTILDRNQRVALGVAASRGACAKIDGHDVGGVRVVGRVGAGAAVERIGTRAAIERIVAAAADELLGAGGRADDDVGERRSR